MSRSTPLWVEPTTTELEVSAATALKLGFFGAFIAASLLGLLFLLVFVLIVGGINRAGH